VGLVDFLLGRRLANRESVERKIGAFEGVPAMGLDGLSSSAYGPEAALTVLMPLGAASLLYIGWIMAPIVALLLILFASYWQTIRAYPNNGGSYIVSKDNLGTNASLLAAAALMVDYMLNVAVGISAGVGALISAVPALQPHIVALCLGTLLLITLANLRGTLDAGRLFALPTYLFVGSFAVILGLGLYRAIHSGGHPQPVVPPPPLGPAAAAVSLWLLLRAFASGCTAMTGVEAVSNGMTAFREPPVKYGHRTLAAIVIILGVLLAGIAYLVTAYRIGAMDQTKPGYRSVLSQLASAVVGNGRFYYVAIGSVLCVLALSANTSFVDFPRLCRMVAVDGYLPKAFAVAGRRLVFSVGILYLAATAGVLLVVFRGITDRLIPLFAIGAFLTFTLSQAGMVVHWRRALRNAASRAEARAQRTHLWINLVGAATTAMALAVIVLAKFAEGAWIVLLVIPVVIALLKAIRGYYDELAARVRDPKPLQLRDTSPPIILVTTEDWNRLTDKALSLALTLSRDVIAVHLTQLLGPEGEENDRRLRERWRTDVVEPARAAGFTPPLLVIMQAQYRTIHEPVLNLVRELEMKYGGRRVAVFVPEIVKERWYQHLLHTHRARHLRSQLVRYGDPGLVVMDIPWRLEEGIECGPAGTAASREARRPVEPRAAHAGPR
jgi:amino acid transporter